MRGESVAFPSVLNIFPAVVSVLSNVNCDMLSGDVSKPHTDQEAKFIHVISNIRTELDMIQDMLSQQEHILSKLLADEIGTLEPLNRPG